MIYEIFIFFIMLGDVTHTSLIGDSKNFTRKRMANKIFDQM